MVVHCSIVDERPKRYRANYKQCREEAEVSTGPTTIYLRSFYRTVWRKRPTWTWPRAVAEHHVHGMAMIKDKGMLRDKEELMVSVSWEVRDCELRSQRVRIASSRECGPREREHWIRGDESCKLSSCLNYNTLLWLVHVKPPCLIHLL